MCVQCALPANVRHCHSLQAGMRMLQQGGSAADAAVAMAAALNVTEPCSTGESAPCCTHLRARMRPSLATGTPR